MNGYSHSDSFNGASGEHPTSQIRNIDSSINTYRYLKHE